MKTAEAKNDISLKMKKVLVVEDFFNFRLTMKNMLRSFGVLYIDDATNGEEAIHKMTIRRFDIVLCDYNLGQGKSGQQVLEEAKYRNYMNYSTVFIMVTAENTLEMVMGAAEYQPDDYLMKPFAKEVLEKKIKSIIQKKENFKEIDKAIAENSYALAINLCDDLIAKAPRNLSELMKLKGEMLLKNGNYQEASNLYEKVLLMGNVGWAELGRGKAALMMGDYQEAKTIFEGIIAGNDKIMAAYDYLAQTLAKLDDHKEAQQVLMRATNISPRAIMRQKALGNLAYRNDDFAVAETSFKKAVEHGKYSCMKAPSDYTSLAKSLAHLDASEESLDVLNVALKEFPDSDEAKLHVSVTESYVYKKMNREEDAKKAMAEAKNIADKIEGGIPPEVELDLAKTYILMGEEEKGKKIIKRIVQCNYDKDETIDIVKTVFKEAGMEEKGQQFIDLAKDEIIALNNEGVALTQEGRIEEAIDYFEKAALHVPENKIINANAAHVLMLHMKECGINNEKLARAKMYLDMVKKIDDHYKDLPMLQAMYNELAPH